VVLYSGGQVVAVRPTDYGDRAPLLSPNGGWPAPEGVPLLEARATFAEIYRRQVWVATLVNKVATAQARLPFKTYRKAPGARVPTPDSPFGELMLRPTYRHGHYWFWLWTASTLEIQGEALWVKIRDTRSGLPITLAPLHPANVEVQRRPGGYRYAWRHRGPGGEEVAWEQDDVIHFKLYDPDGVARGMSRLEPLRRTLLAEQAVQVAQESFWRRGARPSVLLRHPQTLSADASRRLAAQWEALNGGAANWGRTAVLEEGMDAQVVQLSAQEMQMIESRRVSREEACSLYDVPPPVVHILDRATFSNITEQMRSMYRDTMAPRLALYESVVLEQLAAEFGDDAYARFLLDDVLRGDFEKRSAAYAQAIYYGWMKPSEVRVAEDLAPAGDEADQLYVSSAMIPMAAAADAGPPIRATGGPRPDAKGLRAALGRLSRAERLEDVALGPVTRGLDAATADVVALHLAHATTRGDDLAGLRAVLRDELALATDADEEARDAAADA
jgi:HK97 family phage portal protein